MSQTASPGIRAYRESINLEVAPLVAELRDMLGAKVVAYLAGVGETRAVRQWADGSRKMPAETEARLRLASARGAGGTEDASTEISASGVVIDEASYTARVNGTALNLTYKEFELLKYLAQHPGRVFTRDQLLHEVWGYDYYGGTRTVDVHVRRLRAKLGTDHETLIGTVRNVGYRFTRSRAETPAPASQDA